MAAWRDIEAQPETLVAARDIAKRKAEEFRERSLKAARAAAEKHAAKKALKKTWTPPTPPKATKETTTPPERAGLMRERARILGLLWDRLTERMAEGPDGLLGGL